MRHLIFTRYNEPSESIDKIIDSISPEIRIFVYDRGTEKLSFASSNRLTHIHDENKGREDGGYLRHIIHFYPQLSPNDSFVFSQMKYDDAPWENKGDFLSWANQDNITCYDSYTTTKIRCFLNSNCQGHVSMPYVWNLLFPLLVTPDYIDFFPCAIFRTCGSSILKRPIEFYKHLYELTSDPVNCQIHWGNGRGLELPWCLERFWETIFCSSSLEQINP